MKVFQTFCHINEYEDRGFANLHRMIATSEPLVLWAPSSQLLTVPQCRVGREEFVEYVETGRVRIVGRENWLLDKDTRNDPVRMPWPGARWDDLVDGAIRAIAREDENLPDDDKRVLVAPDERGAVYAADYLDRLPHKVTELHEMLRSAEDRQRLPPGLLGALERETQDPHALVSRVLRTAFNHGEAIHLASAHAPFFLTPRESKFLELLDDALRDSARTPAVAGGAGTTGAVPPEPTLTPEEHALLTQEVFEILTALDGGRGGSLKGFLAGAGHQALSTWYREVCGRMSERLPEHRPGTAISELQKEYESGAEHTSLRDVLFGVEGSAGTMGIGFSVADWLLQGTISGFGLAGLAAGLVGPGYGALRILGYTRAGPRTEWPFLYSFGHRPTRNQYERVVNALDRLTPSG